MSTKPSKILAATPIIGVELEFYVSPQVNITALEKATDRAFKSERGAGQFEVDFGPSADIAAIIGEIEDFRAQMLEQARIMDGWVSFDSKPFPDDFGSAMHVHINFEEDFDLERCAQILCHRLDEYIPYCLPEKDDYLRLDHRFMAPTHVSWGGNNRTTMIRVPDALPKRLEHRLPGANADPAMVINGLLQTLLNGLQGHEPIPQTPKIYGNAFDAQYSLRRIGGAL